jgi:polyphosphate kinase
MGDATPAQFINRELSWLAFNHRVLEEALDDRAPLLERVKFLAITSSNLDEFMMVRVGGLQQLIRDGKKGLDPSGMTPEQQLEAISARVHEMVAQQQALFARLETELAQSGIRRIAADQLTPDLHEYLQGVFEHEVYPVVTPVAVESGEDFPLLPGLGLNIAVRLKAEGEGKKNRYAVIALPRRMSRFITLPIEQGHNYVLLEDVAGLFIDRFFPGEPIAEWVPFRITRNADMSVAEDVGDFLLEMKEILYARKQASCVRLEIAARSSRTMLQFLQGALRVKDPETYEAPGPLDLSSYMGFSRMTGFDDLREKPWPPQASPLIRPNESIFDAIARNDILLVHPYESFDPVVRLVEEAADDPSVLAIKQILYRTSEKSPIVAALARAATKDKHVTAIVELKARFDEARNIGWAEALEQTGVQVIYGIKGLKTHAKVCIVVRREPTGIRRYVHFGTGNYNEITARLYSDVSYMTAQEDLGADATAFFNTITGYSQPVRFRKIEAAPIGLRSRVIELIESETERQKQGQQGHIIAKVNSLVDTEIIRALYKASQAGVKIQLNVRGACCLKPGVPGLSENISVVSIVGRFLEHARILYFHHGGEPLVFISSADWMPRNLDRRVELLVPVDDDASRARLIKVLQMYFRDTAKARRLQPDGTHVRAKPERGGAVHAQDELYRLARENARQAQKNSQIVFEPQRPANTA